MAARSKPPADRHPDDPSPHRAGDRAVAADIDEMHALVRLVDRCGYDSLWVGDHISFAVAILDPLLQLAQAAVVEPAPDARHIGLSVPLRHPAPVAKQVATLDHLSEGRLIFGVGIGGEFPKEYEVCGVPLGERGARLTDGIPLLRHSGAASRSATPAAITAGSATCDAAAGASARRTADLVRRPRRRGAAHAPAGWPMAGSPMS